LGYQSFAAIGNGNTTYYAATDTAGNWEVGLGTYSTTGPTLTRTTIYASSNAGSAVTFSGTVSVFVTYPSGQAVYEDAAGTVTSGVWQGSTIGVAYGGTGVTTSSGANSVVLRDANQNIAVNSVTQSLAATVASGGTTTLTPASPHFQILDGTGTHTFKLPDATTLPTGSSWVFDNDATGNLTVTDNASAVIDVVAPGGYTTVFLEANGTVGGTWGRFGMIPAEVNWGTNSLALGPTIVSGGTWQGGTIQSGYGGTGLTTFAGANNALYSTSASALAAGTLPVPAGGTGVTTSTGSGSVVLSTSPTLVTPALGTPTSGNFSTGTFTWPTFNQNTTGTASNVTGVVAVPNGGTGLTSLTAGNIPYGNGTGAYSSTASLNYTGTTLSAPNVTASNGLFINATTVSSSATVGTGFNAHSIGPVTIASGQTVTVASGQRWLIF
jgi:hypothetical protein